jgi:Mg-chelatase subunit ChlD
MASTTAISNTEIIKNSYIDFHTKLQTNTSDLKFVTPFEDETQEFGILKIKVNDTPMTKSPQFILFTLDRSQSMSEICEGKLTKMEHAKHTIKNIVKLIVKTADKSGPIFIQVFIFDDEVEEVISKIQVSKENIAEINKKINSIEPRNSTNIESALQKAREILESEYMTDISRTVKTHIFLTDGIPTAGETNITRLIKKETEKEMKKMVNQEECNVYIGYGEDHNGNLLQTISSNKKNGYYYFVDKIENAGFVFGEIIHGILYPALNNVNITIDNGEIYNYKTNTWSTHLHIPTILSESKKIYHVRSKIPNDIQATLVAKNAITNEEYNETIYKLPYLITRENTIYDNDLTKYILRQKTQEYLYHARSVSLSIDNASNVMIIYPRHTKKEISEKMQNMRKEIKSFLEFLKNHIKVNDLQNDKFYAMLYEDVYVAYKTFGTERGIMYVGARQNSQGRQTSYTVASQIDNDLEFNDIRLTIPTTNSDNLSVNTTPTQLKVMCYVSDRSSSPPLIQSEDIRPEDYKPLTELDNIMLFNRRNVVV